MNGAEVREPFEMLRRLDRLGREHQAELPAQQEVREIWAGIGFRIGGRRFVTEMGEITEILTYPQVSRVPHARSWVRGVANVRGNLLPVMDLSEYLGRGGVDMTRLARVLVIEQESMFAGLLVDEVLGMRHFLREEWNREATEVEGDLRPYVDGVFRSDGSDWMVFSMAALARHPQFLKVAE